ncbi:ExeA family protein [Nitrospira moscoviensis]|uniref:General secretion pathway protein A n=1 Tax=Nitrospira moscoviensis TaxID=42253 RepID=A0A0K2GCE4_NITMO|nr:AAA family ATPase [Nitrospira moscoviensis]ALA58272.1 General secretion pathway protein A [Nitrospira moscoviensis]
MIVSAVDAAPAPAASQAGPVEWSYEGYWGLAARPFDNVPDPRFYIPSAQHEAAKRRILYGIHGPKGIVMLTGEIGSGKTLMTRALVLSLPHTRYDVGLVANPSMPEEEFLGEILFQFGMAPGGSKAEQLRRLNERLLANHQHGIETILIVDEAQGIRHDEVFEDLRLLSNFQLNDRCLLTLVLFGQPELRERVARIPQLAQRVAVHAHLPRFTRPETKAYVRGRLVLAGSTRDMFSPGALAQIHAQTGGICRLINALCDACLDAGRRAGASRVGRRLVGRLGQELLCAAQHREGI